MKQSTSLSLTVPTALRGEITLPGDKSLSHRAALFAALATGESTIDRFLVSGVTRALLNALTALNVPWYLDQDRLTVKSKGFQQFSIPEDPIYCGNSATTIRLVAGALAAAGIPCTLDGSEGLRKRPMTRISDPLAQMGVPIVTTNGCAPMHIKARPASAPLRAIDYTLNVASAQVKSCLILAALAANGTSTFREPGPSRDHTERMLRSMGASIRTPVSGIVEVDPLNVPLTPLKLTLPGDISSAAFLLVAAAIVPDSKITIRDVGINPTRTGILDVLREMGAVITIKNEHLEAGEPVGDIYLAAAPLHGITVSGDTVVRMIDEFPIFAIAAAAATGVTHVREAEELRYKETDRISILCAELRKLGLTVEECQDGFSIHGKTLRGGVANACGDHRLAMSLALAGLISPDPITVEHAEIYHESFPTFTSTLEMLGVRASEKPLIA